MLEQKAKRFRAHKCVTYDQKKNLHYSKTFTFLDHHYFQEKLDQYQTSFNVYQVNEMNTGTFTFMPADKNWVYIHQESFLTNVPIIYLKSTLLVED